MAGFLVFAYALLMLLTPSAGGAPVVVDDQTSPAADEQTKPAL